jgi:hypothetical protein
LLLNVYIYCLRRQIVNAKKAQILPIGSISGMAMLSGTLRRDSNPTGDAVSCDRKGRHLSQMYPKETNSLSLACSLMTSISQNGKKPDSAAQPQRWSPPALQRSLTRIRNFPYLDHDESGFFFLLEPTKPQNTHGFNRLF